MKEKCSLYASKVRNYMFLMLLSVCLVAINPISAQAAETLPKGQHLDLTSDRVVPGDYDVAGSLTIKKGATLTVTGTIYATGEIFVERGAKLVVNGNYYQEESDLRLDGGAIVTIGGNLKFQDRSGVAADCRLRADESSSITVAKDLVYDGTGWESLHANIVVKGNFTDLQGKTWRGQVKLAGTTMQKLTMDQETFIEDLYCENKNIKIGKYFSAKPTVNLSVVTDEPMVYITKGLYLEKANMTFPAGKTVVADSEVKILRGHVLNVPSMYVQEVEYLYMETGAIFNAGTVKFEDISGVECEAALRAETGAMINCNGSFLYHANGWRDLYATISVKNNFIDKMGYDWNGKLILNGANTTTQLISLQAESYVNNISAVNPNIKVGSYFSGSLAAPLSVTSDATVINISDGFDLGSYSLTFPAGKTVVADKKVKVNRGSKLIVLGNYIQENEALWLEGGAIVNVNGNMKFQDRTGVTATSSLDADAGSVINVGGAFVYDASDWNQLNATINVKGSFIDKIGDTWGGRVNLNGAANQLLSLSENSYMSDIGGTNKNVKLGQYFSGVPATDFSFTTDSNAIYITKEMILSKASVTFPANATIYATSNVEIMNGKKLIAYGSYLQEARYLKLNTGAVFTTLKDLRFQNRAGGEATSVLESYAGAVVNVMGNLVYNSNETWYLRLLASIYVKGNLTDMTDGGRTWSSVTLNGTGVQNVTGFKAIEKLYLYNTGRNYNITPVVNVKAFYIDKNGNITVNGTTSWYEAVDRQTPAGIGHSTITTTERQNIKPATTSANGTYDEVVMCSVCKAKIRTNTVTFSKIKGATLSMSETEYTGNAFKPGVTVKDAKNNVINPANYTVSYSKNTNVGKATVKVTFKGAYYKGSVSANFVINPQSTKISKLTTAKKNMTVNWAKRSKQTDGYEIQYSTSSKFTKSTTKTVKVTKPTTTSQKITKLKSKKTYYVRIRTYKKVGTKVYNSAWSSKKSIKVK